MPFNPPFDINGYDGINLKLPTMPKPFLLVTFDTNLKVDENIHCQAESFLPFADSNVMKAKISNQTIIAQGDNIKTLVECEMEFTDSISKDHYPGDTIAILPTREIFYAKMYNDNTPLTISLLPGSKKKMPNYLPTRPTTIRKLMHECVDYSCIPKKLLLISLIPYAENVMHKRFLSIICSEEGKQEYNKLFIKQNYTFVQLMYDMETCTPPINVLLEHLPRLMPRPYTIASSPLAYKNKFKIIYSLNDNKSNCSSKSIDFSGIVTKSLISSTFKILNPQHGIVKYCNDQKTNECIYHSIYFRNQTNFQLSDTDTTKDVIMIANGAGISPFLGFLEHRNEMKKCNPQINFGQCWLFYGVRCKLAIKMHLHSFLNAAIDNKTLSLATFTTSRELTEFHSENNLSFVPGKYIQDGIKRCFNTIYKIILSENTKVFVCGGKNMSVDVETMIIKCGNEISENFEKKFNIKKESGLYLVEVF